MEGQRPYTVRSPVGVAEDSLRSRESRVQTLRRIADRGLGARCVRRGHLCTQPKFNIQSRSRERPKIGRSQGRSPCDQSPAPLGREICWPRPKPGLKPRERVPTPEGREFSGGGGAAPLPGPEPRPGPAPHEQARPRGEEGSAGRGGGAEAPLPPTDTRAEAQAGAAPRTSPTPEGRECSGEGEGAQPLPPYLAPSRGSCRRCHAAGVAGSPLLRREPPATPYGEGCGVRALPFPGSRRKADPEPPADLQGVPFSHGKPEPTTGCLG